MGKFFDEETAVDKNTGIFDPNDIAKTSNPIDVAKLIKEKYNVLFINEFFYKYIDGVYKRCSRYEFEPDIIDIYKDKNTPNKVTAVMQALRALSFKGNDFLNRSKLINLKNGMFNIKTGELVDHSPKYYSTIQHSFEYDPNAECKHWTNTLVDIFDFDTDKIEILQEYFGLCLTRDTRYEKSLFLLGDGGTGKSVIIKALQALLGEDNYSAVPLDKIDNSSYQLGLYGKLANISAETDEKFNLSAVFKLFSSGDTLEVNPKFKETFKFTPFCKIVVAMNNLPHISDKTEGTYRKLIVLTFNKSFENSPNKDIDLKHKIIENDLSFIFNWAVDGYKRLCKRGGFNLNDDMLNILNEIRSDKNPAARFAEEILTLTEDGKMELDEIYVQYKNWAENNEGIKRVQARNAFARDLRHYIYKKFPELKGINYRMGNHSKTNYVLGVSNVQF